MEDLCIKGMLRSRRYSRSISGASWGELVRQPEYKSGWYGRELIKADRFFPGTKTSCSCCGHIQPSMWESVREWQCSECWAHHDRDVNAAQNILPPGWRFQPVERPQDQALNESEAGRCIEAGSS